MSAKQADWLDQEAEGEDSLTINNKFAQKFEERKRKAEISSLRERKKHRGYADDGDDIDDSESSSESEDENANLLTPGVEAGVMRTIQLIKERDPSIYDKDKVWFKNETEAPSNSARNDKKKSSVTRYKDVMRERIEKAAERGYASEEDSDEDAERQKKTPENTKTYVQEQADLKNAFLKTTGNDDDSDDDDFLKPKAKSADDRAEEVAAMEKEREASAASLPADEQNALKRYYANNAELDENEKFLRDYILNRRWDDAGSGSAPRHGVTGGNDDEDRDHVEKAEDFERSYNFRFEESNAGHVISYSRNIEGSMRRKDDSRKKERQLKKERKALEKQKKREELKRLKNLKRQEMEKRLRAIEQELGMEGELSKTFSMDMLEGDFDSEKFDEKMNSLYNDDYYKNDDEEIVRPPSDDPDTKDSSGSDSSSSSSDSSSDSSSSDSSSSDSSSESDSDSDAETQKKPNGKGDKGKNLVSKKNKTNEEDPNMPTRKKALEARKKALLDQHLGEMYELDYEDVIGGMPTRFKYREVEKDSFGLSAEEILTAKDSQLSQYVPLKKIAPYRDGRWLASGKSRKNFRAKIRAEKELSAKQQELQAAKEKADAKNKEKGSKKKKKRKVEGLSDSRLDAYGL